MKYEIPTLVKNTTQRITDYVRDCPGCTSRDLAADLDMRPQSVRMALKRMQNKALVKTGGKDPANGLRCWYLSDGKTRVPPQAMLKQETVSSWPALTIPKQNIFSALFLTK